MKVISQTLATISFTIGLAGGAFAMKKALDPPPKVEYFMVHDGKVKIYHI